MRFFLFLSENHKIIFIFNFNSLVLTKKEIKTLPNSPNLGKRGIDLIEHHCLLSSGFMKTPLCKYFRIRFSSLPLSSHWIPFFIVLLSLGVSWRKANTERRIENRQLWLSKRRLFLRNTRSLPNLIPHYLHTDECWPHWWLFQLCFFCFVQSPWYVPGYFNFQK